MVQEAEAGRAEESGFSLGVAVADDAAAGLDCGAAESGHPRSSGVVAAATVPESTRRPRQPTTANKMTISLLTRPRDRRHGATPHPSPLPFGRGEGEASAALGVVYATDSSLTHPSYE